MANLCYSSCYDLALHNVDKIIKESSLTLSDLESDSHQLFGICLFKYVHSSTIPAIDSKATGTI